MTFPKQRSGHTDLTSQEIADRLAIDELVDAYAHCADRRDVEGGQSTVTWEQGSATGVSYCLAHHVKVDGLNRSLMIASIRYLDHFVKMDGQWYFKQRKLMVDWIDNRPLGAG